MGISIICFFALANLYLQKRKSSITVNFYTPPTFSGCALFFWSFVTSYIYNLEVIGAISNTISNKLWVVIWSLRFLPGKCWHFLVEFYVHFHQSFLSSWTRASLTFFIVHHTIQHERWALSLAWYTFQYIS